MPAGAHDLVFRDGFQRVADAPGSDAEAARFLAMATFGPNAADVARLRAVGYRQWIEQQLSLPASLQRPEVEQAVIAAIPNPPGQLARLEIWMRNAVTGPDQLRQRIAWALSQVFVTTYLQSKLNADPGSLAELYDTFTRHAGGWFDADGAFHPGTYESLLGDVTRSPAMAKMLTYLRNRPGDPVLGTSPDENYAREVLQLFSIGLVLRHPDFSPVLDRAGIPIPTYTQAEIGAYARVFTGLSYVGGFNSNPLGANWSPASYQPLTCYAGRHDRASKVLLDYAGADAVPPQHFVLPEDQACETDLAGGLGVIAGHPNVAPFIARQLIQRFTTSNPSPAYVARIAAVFDGDAAGRRGDIGAVVSAILLDDEARQGTAAAPAVFGKAREPLLKLTALYRRYDARAQNGLYGRPNYAAYLQTPQGAPSVFNYYSPDYLPPGELAAAHLVAPELQIVNESSVFSAANDLMTQVRRTIGSANLKPTQVGLDLSPLLPLAGNPAALVARLDADLMYGAMSAPMRATLESLVAALPAGDPMRRVRTSLHVVLASPEFAVQK
ncbi:MAG: DUF1800 family protein [Xanthomonadales bacterium]|nr:DUF1800 family protein [Xanthomonadales bacterium]